MRVRGPPRGYFLEPTKSILVVALGNVPKAEEFFRGMGVNIVTGIRYLGSFSRNGAAEKIWLAKTVEGWTEFVRTQAVVACKHP